MVNDLTRFEEFWAAEKWQEEFSIKVLPVSEQHITIVVTNVKHIKQSQHIHDCHCRSVVVHPLNSFSLLLINEVEYGGVIGQLYLNVLFDASREEEKNKIILLFFPSNVPWHVFQT